MSLTLEKVEVCGLKLKALYYPYARSFNRTMLKQAILIFDEIWFSDPMERAVREAIMYYDKTGMTGHDKWNSIKDDYAYLAEKGVFKILNPCPIVREYDGLMAQALLCDIQDKGFMSLASEAASRDYWGILRERIPADLLFRHATNFLGTRFWRTPTSIKSPPATKWTNSYGSYHDFSSPYIMSINHDYIPISCGYSININHALLISELKGLTLFTDDLTALRLLTLKYSRAKSKSGIKISPSSFLAQRSPEYLQKYNLLALNVVEALIPSNELDRRSFHDLVRFREKNRVAFKQLRNYMFELTSHTSSEPWSESLENEILKLIDTKVIPEVTRVRNTLQSAYERTFGSIIKKAAATVTPTLIASFLSGLSSGQILTLSCAAMAGALSIALPDIVDLWKEKQKINRNSLCFLLQLK